MVPPFLGGSFVSLPGGDACGTLTAPVCKPALPCLQVGLYAEFAPGELMPFLVSSQSYALGEAFELCAAAGLVREQVRPATPLPNTAG